MTQTTDKLAMFHFRQRLASALDVMATGRISEARLMLAKLYADADARVELTLCDCGYWMPYKVGSCAKCGAKLAPK